jgi:hypothetical protein
MDCLRAKQRHDVQRYQQSLQRHQRYDQPDWDPLRHDLDRLCAAGPFNGTGPCGTSTHSAAAAGRCRTLPRPLSKSHTLVFDRRRRGEAAQDAVFDRVSAHGRRLLYWHGAKQYSERPWKRSSTRPFSNRHRSTVIASSCAYTALAPRPRPLLPRQQQGPTAARATMRPITILNKRTACKTTGTQFTSPTITLPTRWPKWMGLHLRRSATWCTTS